jgi:hypothetical protein
MKRASALLVLALLPLVSLADEARIKMPDFSGLAAKATKSVDISLDKNMVNSAAAFMSGGKMAVDPAVVEMINGLDGIYVRAFNFDRPDVYSAKDIEAVTRQVDGKGWKKLISVQEKGERMELWMRENMNDGGMLMIAAKPMELVLVNIAGSVNLQSLAKLQGSMGVPMIPGIPGARPAAPAETPPAR